ncbi:hypothetical protein ElyMa_004373400 [Elysia marginata]|uniref:Uncharacterized protein n=1 Tax=Elysia marginata TaxID=1093978 RepID=A0AAV4H9E8_9GAST|nr:hypothetical protein ElyMa_004373400 [Elysia marginata]
MLAVPSVPSLGARHGDKDGVSCSGEDPFQPGSGIAGRGDVLPSASQRGKLAVAPYWLPSCSLLAIRDHLRSVSCARGDPEDIQDRRAIGPSDQCVKKIGIGSSYCRVST